MPQGGGQEGGECGEVQRHGGCPPGQGKPSAAVSSPSSTAEAGQNLADERRLLGVMVASREVNLEEMTNVATHRKQ